MLKRLTHACVGLLLALFIAAATAPSPAMATEPPPVPPQLPEPAWPEWDTYFTGCTDWVLNSGQWTFSCGWQGETWISSNFYYWDAPSHASVLYRSTYFDWIDMWGWDCYIPGQCNA